MGRVRIHIHSLLINQMKEVPPRLVLCEIELVLGFIQINLEVIKGAVEEEEVEESPLSRGSLICHLDGFYFCDMVVGMVVDACWGIVPSRAVERNMYATDIIWASHAKILPTFVTNHTAE